MSRDVFCFEDAALDALDDIRDELHEIAATLARIADALQPVPLSAVVESTNDPEAPR